MRYQTNYFVVAIKFHYVDGEIFQDLNEALSYAFELENCGFKVIKVYRRDRDSGITEIDWKNQEWDK